MKIQPTEISTEYLVPSQEKYNHDNLNINVDVATDIKDMQMWMQIQMRIQMRTQQLIYKYEHANMDANTCVNIDMSADVNMNIDTNTDVNVNIDANVNVDIGANAATDMYNSELFDTFLKTIKDDYEHCGSQLQAALEKLAERYNTSKIKSIPALISFLYNVNHNLDALVRVKSGVKIHVQVESVMHRKTKSGVSNSGSKENCDPHVILACKVRAIGNKKHDLSQNINKNNLNL
ncbi:hypothetical protein C2G38_2169148 [Gigaspora rosea]|uniref:Uncharacterized protein n=1 Tax=Gigaspora rosea TaxID=44941 RepID=A0A397VSC5_9GLOM|nr:hypothetical protein C2G38_2169148 [Gigaspora rosea]